MSVVAGIRNAVRLATLGLSLVAFSPLANAQQPSPAAMASAKELISITGATTLFSPLIAGVVEQAKVLYLQQNPALSKDLNEIATRMRTDLFRGNQTPSRRKLKVRNEPQNSRRSADGG